MVQKKKNEELQSRREFFKKAAKAALPVIGAVVLAQIPNVASATSWGCKGSCYGGCDGTCDAYCADSCERSCDRSCQWGCRTQAYA